MKTLIPCIPKLRLSGSESRQLHDAAILDKVSRPQQEVRMQKLSPRVLQCTCAVARVHQPPQSWRWIWTPDSIDGWLDKKMLRGRSNEMRATINRLQAERGWHATSFERLARGEKASVRDDFFHWTTLASVPKFDDVHGQGCQCHEHMEAV